ncbi:hypothetical protein V4Y02_23370, partial [Escherichia coli]
RKINFFNFFSDDKATLLLLLFFRERERELFIFLVFGEHNIFVCGAEYRTRAARMPGEHATA